MSFPRYPAYKDSGVEWLGKVPEHWEVKRLRHAATLNPSKQETAHLDRATEVSFLPMEAIGDDGSLNLERTRPIGDVETGYTYFREGDVTLAKITPCFENGKGGIMRYVVGAFDPQGVKHTAFKAPTKEERAHPFLWRITNALPLPGTKVVMKSGKAIYKAAAALERHAFAQVVLDPVMVATSGSVLMEDSTVSVLVKRLFPLASVITPNLDEAALLLGRKLETVEQMRSAAHELQAMGARAVLLKGGHLPGERVADVLLLENGEELVMDDARIATRNTHGTGCTLSSAIASYLALGEDLPDAVRMAREFVRKALEAGANVRTGGVGNGPLNHGFAPRVMRMDRL